MFPEEAGQLDFLVATAGHGATRFVYAMEDSIAFPCCILDKKTSNSGAALNAMETFLATHDHAVESLKFSVSYLKPEEIRRLVVSSKDTLKVLHLTLRYYDHTTRTIF